MWESNTTQMFRALEAGDASWKPASRWDAVRALQWYASRAPLIVEGLSLTVPELVRRWGGYIGGAVAETTMSGIPRSLTILELRDMWLVI